MTEDSGSRLIRAMEQALEHARKWRRDQDNRRRGPKKPPPKPTLLDELLAKTEQAH